MASAMGSWWAQLAPEMYWVILDTMSGVSCTAEEDQEWSVGMAHPSTQGPAARLGMAERLLWLLPSWDPGEASPNPEKPSPAGHQRALRLTGKEKYLGPPPTNHAC